MNYKPLHPFFPFSQEPPDIGANIEKYIRETLSTYWPGFPLSAPDAPPWAPERREPSPPRRGKTYDVFELHGYVIVRLNVPATVKAEDIAVQCGLVSLIVEFPSHSVSIPLPALVKRKRARALFKDGVLEVRLPKAVDSDYEPIAIETP